jgi:SAM-dependent methyltransferase
MAQAARRNGQPALAADEETLPFAEASFDAVFSLLSLHWVNDLPGALVQIRRALKPDGLFLAALLGGETLTELRGALMQAEIEEEGGAGPRVSPFADVAQAGGLLQRAGFALPVADVDSITVSYPDAFRLMQDLRGMGETNAVAAHRRTASRRATLMRAAALYSERHADQDGRLPATFQVVYLTAWAPHESQPQPLRPGSAKARLADALGTEEQSAGEKADPGGQRRPK